MWVQDGKNGMNMLQTLFLFLEVPETPDLSLKSTNDWGAKQTHFYSCGTIPCDKFARCLGIFSPIAPCVCWTNRCLVFATILATRSTHKNYFNFLIQQRRLLVNYVTIAWYNSLFVQDECWKRYVWVFLNQQAIC